MNINFTDKEKQVTLAALQHFYTTKAGNANILNEYDILARGHTLAATLTAMEKISKKPIASLLNPQQRS